MDAVVEGTLKPWDWAALVPVIEGAGGRMTDWQGRTLTLESKGEVIAVGDPALCPRSFRFSAELAVALGPWRPQSHPHETS